VGVVRSVGLIDMVGLRRSPSPPTVHDCTRVVGGLRATSLPVLGALFFTTRGSNSISSTSYPPRDAMLARILAIALCCVCHKSGVLSKRLNESGWFLAGELLSTYPTLRYNRIQITSKIGILPSGTLLPILDFENFASAYRLSKRVINLARER